jgi:hypothetical protein
LANLLKPAARPLAPAMALAKSTADRFESALID